MKVSGCPLCEGPGGLLLYAGPQFRVIRAQEEGFPAFWRVIWNAHVREFSDLSMQDRVACMEAVARVEQAVRTHLQPDKVNLAALGNLVPHLHWHVIGRFEWDSRFPAPVWAAPVREPDPAALSQLESRCASVDAAIRSAFAA